MLRKEIKARRRYNCYCRVKSRKRHRRDVIKACDWVYRQWTLSEPVGPFLGDQHLHEMLQHQKTFLDGFRKRMKSFISRQSLWHRKNPLINNGLSSYQLALEFKRFLTQDLKVCVGQTYVFYP